MSGKGLGLLVLLFLALRASGGGGAVVGAFEKGNSWFAIRYRTAREPVWGSPFWSDQWTALQLKPTTSELWTWNGRTWERKA